MNLLKIAMLSSVSESNDRIVTLNHIKLSLGLLNEIESNVSMVTSRMGRSEVGSAVNLILSLLRQNGGKMLECDLKSQTFKEFKNGMEQYSTMRSLQEMGKYIIVPQKVGNVERRFACLPEVIKKEPPK